MLRQAEQAYGDGRFAHAVKLLHLLSAVRHHLSSEDRFSFEALSGLLAERAGNWPEAVHRWLAAFDEQDTHAGQAEQPTDASEDRPCDLGCDCDVRTVLDAPGAASGEPPCLCCRAHALWRLTWQAACRGALGEVLDAVPDRSGLRRTAVLHALAVGTLRALAERDTTDPRHAVFAVAVWRLLLDEEDPLGHRTLIQARRGTPVEDTTWQDACDRLAQRIRTALRSVDERDGHDVLGAWETAWDVEESENSGELVRGRRAYLRMEDCFGQCAGFDPDIEVFADVGDCVCDVDTWQPPAPDTAPPCLGTLYGGRPVSASPVTVDSAARLLEERGDHRVLLDAYTRRHGEPGSWHGASHLPCAPHLAPALATRAREQHAHDDGAAVLDDLTAAVRLGLTTNAGHRAMAREAGLRAGRNGNGYQRASLAQRVHWLEAALALAPDDTALGRELAATLVRRGTQALAMKDEDAARARFRQALVVRPGDPEAQHALDLLDFDEAAAVIKGDKRGRRPGLKRLGELLRRLLSGSNGEGSVPGMGEVLDWYQDRITDRIVEKAAAGDRSGALRDLRRLDEVCSGCSGAADPRPIAEAVGGFVHLLRDRARRLLVDRPDGYTAQVPRLLAAAATFDGNTGTEAEDQPAQQIALGLGLGEDLFPGLFDLPMTPPDQDGRTYTQEIL
ncbi:hypothetical protein [Streptomyces sp. KL116D]|uniref:hypothetical protein n=1 Tax=Streptomyces sp. KL116D TaxID=3045152 RepID=UPI003558E90A